MAFMSMFLSRKFMKFCKYVPKPYQRRSTHNLVHAKYAQTLLNLPEVKVTELQNGLRIATESTSSPTSTVGIWIDAGSRFETNETNGVANFFEHLAFKGTNKKSVVDLEKQIGNIGAKFRSYTGREETAFYANCLAADAPKVIEILAEVLCDPKFDDNQIERERKVILRELEQVESNLKQVTFDYLHLTAYQGTPLEKSIYGSTENIKHISKNDIASYVRNNFLAARMVLTASGCVNHDELVKVAEKHFNSVPITYTEEIPLINPCRFTGSDVRSRDDWIPYGHVAIAVDTCGIDNSDIYPLMLGQHVIGSWNKTLASSADTTNQLIRNIYKGEGCQSYEAFHILYRDSGLWGCYFVMDGMALDDFMFNLQNEWMKLCVNISETELQIAKNNLRTSLFLSHDNATKSCRNIARQVLYCRELTSPEEIEEAIKEVTLNDFKDVCSKYIYDRCPAVSAVGPVEGLTDYVRIRSNMYWLRY